MKVRVLFAQRIESYPGQYGLEALAVMTEHDEDENDEYLPTELEKARTSGEFRQLALVTLKVSEGEIRNILQPTHADIKADVVIADDDGDEY